MTDTRWHGRNADKDALRHHIWTTLDTHGAGVGDVWSRIPNFVGSDAAAERLAGLAVWQRARVVKCGPDTAQSAVRLRALKDGKRLYMPIPQLKEDLPFVLLDLADLQQRGVTFEDVAHHQGATQHGRKIQFEDMQPIDLLVAGCVAVTRQGGRTGKGAGFADLEMGIMYELGLIAPDTPIVTTVHSLQVVGDDRVVMQSHDWPLDWIVTPDEAIETRTPYPRPTGILWDKVQPDQFRDIPVLARLKGRIG